MKTPEKTTGTAQTPQQWDAMKSKIQTKFSKLSSADIDGLKGHMDQLSSKVQKVYNYEKSKAESECKEFNQPVKA